MAMPTIANTMWKARDTAIWERAARRSDMDYKLSCVGSGEWGVGADVAKAARRRARPCARRRHGHHAVREGLLPERLLRRAEPKAAEAHPGSARGLRARRRRAHRDEHLRREPQEARELRARGRHREDQHGRGTARPGGGR